MGNWDIPGSNIYDKEFGFNLMHTARVVSTADEADGGRIRARIKGVDDKLSDADLPFAFPFTTKLFSVKPKIGETVLILRANSENQFENRFFVGPLLSQPQFFNKDNHFFSSQSMLDTGFSEPSESPSRVPEARGVYPDPQHVSIQGRGNSDMIFKEKEVLIRAGKFVTGNRLRFNQRNPGYIQIKHDANISTDEEEEKLGTTTNIVSDKINLLTHENGDPRFSLTNRERMISESELTDILNRAHPIVFGDRLIEFIELLQKYVKNHIHPYHGLPADETELVKKIMDFDLDSLTSENVKAN